MPSAGAITMTLKGYEDLEKAFNGLHVRIQKKMLRPALRAGAKVLREGIKHEIQSSLSTTSQDAPHLADHLRIKAMKRDRSKKGRIGYVVISGFRDELGIKKKDTYYPAHIEYGHLTRKPSLSTQILDSVSRGSSNRQVQYQVHHVPANPYMKRGLEGTRSKAMSVVESTVIAKLREYSKGGDAFDVDLDTEFDEDVS